MALFHWDDSFKVNVTEFDVQHQMLVAYVNELYNAIEARRSRKVIAALLDKLIRYTESHFAAEEQMMEELGYPVLDQHKAEHDELTQRVMKFKRDFESTGSALSLSLLVFLKDWVRDHIRGTDRSYSQFFNANGLI